jgi:pimeloyl-CoA dehydrogenase small subunit
MDFDLTEEQSILKDSLDRLLAAHYGFEQRRAIMAAPEGFSGEMWGRYAEMGLMALPFAEEDGGIGGTAVETMLVMEAFGKVLVLEPYWPTVVLGGGLIRFGGSDAQRAALAPAVAEGALKLAFAQGERNSRYDLHHVETKAAKNGAGWRISGRKFAVIGGDSADKFFVTARTAGDARDEGGIGVFLVDARADGVSVRPYRMQDGQGGAEVTFDNVAVGEDAVFGDPEGGLFLARRAVDAAIAALCAESVGAMAAMQALTVDYLKVRKQFGQFQVLQHKAVDMFVATEQARSMAFYATSMADSDDEAERGRAIHAAKAEIGRAGRIVGENAIQLHGGVGMTDEYAVGHYFKRVTAIDITLGDAGHHLRALATKGGLFQAA